MHARLGRLVSAAEDLLPGICIISCGMERPRHSHELPVEEQGAFRAHFLVTDGAGRCLQEDSCHRLARTLEQSLLACLTSPMLEDREHCVAEGNGCNLQQQEKQQQQHPSREQLPHSLKTTTDLPLPSQLNSSSESSSTPMSCNVLPTAVPEPVAWPQLSQQTSMSQLPLQAELTGQRTMSGLLSDSSTFLHPGSCTSSSSASVDAGFERRRVSAGASLPPTHEQICISPSESMAASISSLTAQARGVSREDRFRAAAALWELDMKEIHFHHKLGEGSFGEVWLGSFRGTKVAIKRMHEGQVHHGGEEGPGTAAQSFEREIETLACIRHPNVVNFFGASHAPPHLCLVTEHCARGSLDQLLHKSGLQINLVRATEFAIDIARGMNCLHEQRPAIIHRDLKTANLLVSARFEVKVADLGLSCVKDQARTASPQAWLEGTVEYSAPEVLRGEPYSEKCDVWSYGVVLHELLTRERPYSDIDCSVYLMMIKIGDGSLRLPPVPEKLATPGLARLVSRCLSMQPGDRPSFRDVLFHLEPEYKIARGRAPAVPRSGSATSMLESCKLQQQLLRHGNAAQTQRRQQQQQQQEGQQDPGQLKQQQQQQQQSKLPTCSAFDPLPPPEASCSPPAEQHAAAMEARNSSDELQQLHHATVSSQVSIMPPTRAQAPTPAYNRCPSADLVHSEPVVKMKHRESKLAGVQQQRQEEEQQQEDLRRRRQQALRDHQRALFGLSAHQANLPRISEESTARSSMDNKRESGSSLDLPLRLAPSCAAQPPLPATQPSSPVCDKQPGGDASGATTSHDASRTGFLLESMPHPTTPSNNASSHPTTSCPAGASPFSNNGWPSPPHNTSPFSFLGPSDPPKSGKPPLMSSPFADAAPTSTGRRSPQSLFSYT